MRDFRILAVALVSCLAGAAARAEVIECHLEQASGNNGWVAPVVVLSYEDGAFDAIVNDQVILTYVGRPVEAKIEVDNAKRRTFVWKVTAKDSARQQAGILYRLTVMKSDMTARIKAIPTGYANNFDAGGSCQPVKG